MKKKKTWGSLVGVILFFFLTWLQEETLLSEHYGIKQSEI